VSHPERTAYLARRRRALPALAVVSFGLGYALALLRNLFFLLGLLLPLVLAVAYSIGSERMGRTFGISRLKEGFVVKNIAVSFSWSLIPFLVGLYYLRFPLALLAFCPFVFMRLMVNTVFFDVRDIEADRKYGVKTIPATLGLAVSWRLMDAVDIASAVYIVASALWGLLPTAAGILAVFTPYSLAYRYYARRSSGHGDALWDFAADGEYVMWGILVYLGQI
jgi:4-hydroxybenzoate polyprenyltransferase